MIESDEDERITWKSYYKKLLKRTEFAKPRVASEMVKSKSEVEINKITDLINQLLEDPKWNPKWFQKIGNWALLSTATKEKEMFWESKLYGTEIIDQILKIAERIIQNLTENEI